MLCTVCITIFVGEAPPFHEEPTSAQIWEWTNEYRLERERACFREHHTEIKDMARSVLGGCSICEAVWRHFFLDANPAKCLECPVFWRDGIPHTYFGSGTHYRLTKNLPTHETHEWRLTGFELEIGLNSPMDRNVKEYKALLFTPLEDEECFRNVLPRQIKPPKELLDPSTIQSAKKWISDCQLNHQRCNEGSHNPERYPTRLIEMRQEWTDDSVEQKLFVSACKHFGVVPEPCLRLIETAETVPTGPYVSLSHRWLDPGEFKMTHENYKSLKAHVRNTDLPKAVRDTIAFAFQLGFRYIWLDTLCIIQGDAGDWSREAMAMAEVYSGAVLNLSATAGNELSFRTRDASLIKPVIFTPRWTNVETKTHVMCDFRFWEDRVSKSPCNKRAWIMQERWLAPRVLHFAFDQLLWECRELEAAETYPMGLPREIKTNRFSDFKKGPRNHHASALAKVSDSLHQDQYHEWTKILDTYGRCELTYERDKLVAIAGVAKTFAAKYDDEWLAGLWRRMLPGELLWEVWKTRRSNKPIPPLDIVQKSLPYSSGSNHSSRIAPSSRLQTYQAPSWSWASVVGDVQGGPCAAQDEPNTMITILDAHVVPLDSSRPYAQVQAGVLRVRGTLYPMALDPPIGQYNPHDRMALPPWLYVTGLPKIQRKTQFEFLHDGALTHSHIAHVLVDEPTEYSTLANSCFLPVVVNKVHQGKYNLLNDDRYQGEWTNLMSGLCLLAVKGEKKGVYKRLGRVDWGGDECQIFLDGWEAQKARDSGESGWRDRALQTTLDESLYLDGDLGVVEII